MQALQLLSSIGRQNFQSLISGSWEDDKIELSGSLLSLEYLPTPSIDRPLESLNSSFLIHSGSPAQSPISVKAEDDEGLVGQIEISEDGRHEYKCIFTGKDFFTKYFSTRDSSFSFFVPGVSGIALQERYIGRVIVNRNSMAGDANLVFRNILHALQQEDDSWNEFLDHFHTIFKGYSLRINYDGDLQEYIEVFLVNPDERVLPITAAGTGILQAIQILACTFLYRPKLLLLDEPDAHLHPNNQRHMCDILSSITENNEIQLVVASHSRHLLDSLSGNSKLYWINNGEIVSKTDFREASVLMNLGALDSWELIHQGQIKCIVITEDNDSKPLEAVLLSSGFNKEETKIISVGGCSRTDTVNVLCETILDLFPGQHIIFHRDRDYIPDEETTKIVNEIERNVENVTCFLTSGVDIESEFTSRAHLDQVLSETGLDFDSIIDQATNETERYSVDKMTNYLGEVNYRARKKENKSGIDFAEAANQARDLYRSNPTRYRHGKKVLKAICSILQKELQHNVDIIKPSDALSRSQLCLISQKIWPPSKIEATSTKQTID